MPSNREISGLIRELNWEISYCRARSFHWRQLAFVLKENELWLVMKALGIQPDTAKWGRSLTLPISDNGLPCADDFATRTVD